MDKEKLGFLGPGGRNNQIPQQENQKYGTSLKSDRRDYKSAEIRERSRQNPKNSLIEPVDMFRN